MTARIYKAVAQLTPNNEHTLIYTPGAGVSDFITSGLNIANIDPVKRVWITVFVTRTLAAVPDDTNIVYPKTCIEPNTCLSILAGSCLSSGQSFFITVTNPETAVVPVVTLFGTEG